jgi:tetratricopeptide (TPR) repeat protein
VLLVAALGMFASSCAYYNTLYLARRYYFKATDGKPYQVDRDGSQVQNFTKSIDYSKKVLSDYPKSKWVDDAFLLWARALIGREDPLQTVSMLQDFPEHFKKSDLRAEAAFYLGLAYRQARRYPQAVDTFDDFLKMAPKSELAPYALLERARAYVSMQRYAEAADDASRILKSYPKSDLVARALRQRAEARFQQGDFDGARKDFHQISVDVFNDEERFQFFNREVDCLESARKYDEELAALNGELSHTPAPATPKPGELPSVNNDRYGKITLRIGTAHLLAGRMKDALEQYAHVLQDYPKTPVAAEAQYRTGYTYETLGDDFDRALQEYSTVKDQFGQTPYAAQAQQRSDNLGRIMQYRKGAGADSLEKKAEASFLTAELYLFQLDKPDRALEEYGKVVEQYPGKAVAARALNAQAWVLSRKLDRKPAADSLFWKVVREYPATEAQLAARDYLEAEGQTVPENLIVMPKPAPPPPPDTTALAQPPAVTPTLGTQGGMVTDSLGRMRPRFGMDGERFGAPRDSTGRPGTMFGRGPNGMPNGMPGTMPPGMPPGMQPPGLPPGNAPADTTRRNAPSPSGAPPSMMPPGMNPSAPPIAPPAVTPAAAPDSTRIGPSMLSPTSPPTLPAPNPVPPAITPAAPPDTTKKGSNQ